MEFSLEYGILGFLVGVLSSLLGLGGSVLIIPMLPSLAAITFRETIATSLFTVTLVTLSNVIIYHFKRLVVWRQVFILFPLISLGSYLSARNSHLVDEEMIKALLILIMMIMFFRLIRKNPLSFKIKGTDSIFFLPGVGFCTGLLSGITGIGGGLILTPTFIIKKIVDHNKISPTINCLIFLGSLTAVIGYMNFDDSYPQLGAVHLNIGFTVFVFAFFGSLLGIRLNSKISEELRKRIFSTLLFVLALKLVFI